MASDRPCPEELWRLAGGGTEHYSRERCRELLVEYGHLIPLKPGETREPLPCGWPERSVASRRRDEGCGICAGCIGMGPCDDGAECDYGCGARVLMPGDVCAGCEDEATGRGDDEDEAIEMEYADGDYGW